MGSVSHQVKQAQQVADRLARLNVDSIWARRAGGLRGSLLHNITLIERGPSPRRMAHLERLTQQGITILVNAAREIPDPCEHQRLFALAKKGLPHDLGARNVQGKKAQN